MSEICIVFIVLASMSLLAGISGYFLKRNSTEENVDKHKKMMIIGFVGAVVFLIGYIVADLSEGKDYIYVSGGQSSVSTFCDECGDAADYYYKSHYYCKDCYETEVILENYLKSR